MVSGGVWGVQGGFGEVWGAPEGVCFTPIGHITVPRPPAHMMYRMCFTLIAQLYPNLGVFVQTFTSQNFGEEEVVKKWKSEQAPLPHGAEHPTAHHLAAHF